MKQLHRIVLGSIFCGLLFFSCKKNGIVVPPEELPGKQSDIEWPSLAKSPWPMLGGNPQFTGRSKYIVSTDASVRWSLSVPGINSTQSMTSPVMGEDSTIYFISSYESIVINGVRGQVSFLNAVLLDGTPKWKVRLGVDSLDFGPNFCITTPVVLKDGSIVLATPYGQIMSFSSRGRLNWIYHDPNKTFYSGTVTVGKFGEMYITSNEGELYCIEKTGVLRWKIKRDNGFIGAGLSAISISPDGNTIYVGGVTGSKSLYALSVSGELKWSFDAMYVIGAPPVIDNAGNIYIGTFSFQKDSIQSAVYSVTPEGAVRWKYNKNQSVFSGLVLDHTGNVFFLEDSANINGIVSLDYFGKKRFFSPVQDPITSLIVVDGKNDVIVGTNGLLKIFSNEGKLLEDVLINSIVWTMPMVGFDGGLFVSGVSNINQLIYIH